MDSIVSTIENSGSYPTFIPISHTLEISNIQHLFRKFRVSYVFSGELRTLDELEKELNAQEEFSFQCAVLTADFIPAFFELFFEVLTPLHGFYGWDFLARLSEFLKDFLSNPHLSCLYFQNGQLIGGLLVNRSFPKFHASPTHHVGFMGWRRELQGQPIAKSLLVHMLKQIDSWNEDHLHVSGAVDAVNETTIALCLQVGLSIRYLRVDRKDESQRFALKG